VLHSCSEDLEVFHCWLGVLPQPLVDTQRAAALLGEPYGLGYRALVHSLLHIDLDKGETRSDWLRRPLTESQCHYAAQDVLHLLPAWALLKERASSADRLQWVYEEGQEAARLFLEREQSSYRRVKGAGRLSRRETACLAALCDWREARARAVDKPRGWILDDKACLAIASALPAHREALAALDVLPPAVLRRQGDAVLACVQQALAMPESELPASPPPPLAREQRDRLQSLKAAARARAESLGVAPELLMPGADLELLLREAAGQAIDAPARWQGWREAAVIEPLRALAA
jgi:ribonuclease D